MAESHFFSILKVIVHYSPFGSLTPGNMESFYSPKLIIILGKFGLSKTGGPVFGM